MRVAVASVFRGLVGGAETYLRRVLPGLARRGHEGALLYEVEAADGQMTVDAEGSGLQRGPVAGLGAAGALAELAAWRPDVVYVQGLRSADLEEALLGAHPCVLFAHGYYGTCATGRKCFANPAYAPCRRVFGPACLALHYPRRCGGLNPVRAWSSYRLQGRRFALLPRYRALVVASEHMRGEYLRHGVPAARLHRIPPPGPEPGAAPAAIPGAPPRRLLFVGRLTDLKGPRVAVAAALLAQRELARPLSLTVAGSGPEEARLHRLGRRVDLELEVRGWATEAERDELMLRADVLVLPSLWPEPFGLVGVEAGSLGLPAVGFASGGVPDWLLPGLNGELAPGRRPTAAGLAAALVRVLGDSRRHLALREGAREVAARFSLEAHLADLEAVLAEAGP
jgi:glycosyltransferase involved in cell wall biosynthesis